MTILKFKRLKKMVAVSMALVFFTQSTNLPEAAASFYDFFSFGSPRQDDAKKKDGIYSKDQLQEYLKYKNRAVKSQTQAEEMLNRQRAKVLDKTQSNIDKNLQDALQTTEDISKQAEEARNKVFSILGQRSLFNYVRYADGKIIRFRDGLAARVENERIIDTHGNVSIRNTTDMEYNKKRLLTSYNSETKDAQGNVSKVVWSGGVYTDDSVYYGTEDTHARKLVTGFGQETTDIYGNVSKVTWEGAVYEGKLLAGYHQITLDHRGNTSTKDWFGAKYDGNKQITAFTEIETDTLGNTRRRHWSGGTYIPNHAYNSEHEKTGAVMDAPKYLLTGYHEEITDENGLTTTRDWTGATYDEFGQLTSYRESDLDALGRLTRYD